MSEPDREISEAIGQPPMPDEKNPLQNEEPEKKAPPVEFLMKLSDSKWLKDLLKALEVVVDEATFTLTPDALKLRAMDPSRVAMLDLELPKEYFEEWQTVNIPLVKGTTEYDPDRQEFRFCVNLSYLEKTILKNVSCKKDEYVAITRDDVTGRLHVTLTKRFKRHFTMPTLEPSDEDVPLPKIGHNHTSKLVLDSMIEVFKDDVSDHVTFEGDNDKLMVKQAGDITTLDVTLEKGGDVLLDIQSKENSRSIYSLSYLAPYLKSLKPLCDIITLHFSTDMPLKLSAQLPHGGKLDFWLAPRIECE